MSRKWMAGLALMAALAVPAAGWAHTGHVHKTMGTVSAVRGNQVEIKTTDGKTVTIVLRENTTVTRGTAKLTAAAIRAGERVSVDYVEEKVREQTVMRAQAVKLGTTPRGTTANR